MSRRRAATAVLLGLVFAVSLLAAPAGAAASEPCADGTPSAVRFAGLPERLPIGYKERFALDAGDFDWEVTGSIRVTMESGGEVFFEGTTDDPYAVLWLRLDPGDTEATVSGDVRTVELHQRCRVREDDRSDSQWLRRPGATRLQPVGPARRQHRLPHGDTDAVFDLAQQLGALPVRKLHQGAVAWLG